jgi:3-methyl-2-oxobutanoate hydroxymethyltransferase
VGDSLGMVVLGYDSTLPVTVADMVHHTRAARAARPRRSSSPTCRFLSYGTPAQALDSAARLMKEALADSVKLEGGEEVVPIVEALVRAGVPVLGHVGLTPQTASALGGYKLQGKDEAAAKRIWTGGGARAGRLLGRGARARPGPAREARHRAIGIPTIGIGAGAALRRAGAGVPRLVGMFSASRRRS